MRRTGSLHALAIVTVTMPAIVCIPAGCGSGATTRMHGEILGQWTGRISATGLVSIVPPDEDVRVGDIYAFSISPDQLETGSGSARQAAAMRIAASSRWATLPVLTDLSAEYAQRPSWPKTPDVFVSPTASVERWEEPDTDGTSIFSPEQVATRLRIVGMDQFAAVSFTGDDMETIIPTEASTLIAGSADPRRLAVTLRAGSAETYGLSLDTVINLLLDDAAGDGGAPGYVLKPQYRRNLELVADPVTDHVWLQVLSEVVYVRSADITVRAINAEPAQEQVTAEELAKVAEQVQTSSSAAETAQPTQPADAAAQPAGNAGQPAEAQPAAAEPAVDEPDSSDRALGTYAATKLDPLYGAFVRAQAINDVLAESIGDDVPGSLVHFISVTDESVAMRRLWPRGLAVGVRGLILEVDASTGRVLRSGPMGQPLPYRGINAPASAAPGA